MPPAQFRLRPSPAAIVLQMDGSLLSAVADRALLPGLPASEQGLVPGEWWAAGGSYWGMEWATAVAAVFADRRPVTAAQADPAHSMPVATAQAVGQPPAAAEPAVVVLVMLTPTGLVGLVALVSWLRELTFGARAHSKVQQPQPAVVARSVARLTAEFADLGWRKAPQENCLLLATSMVRMISEAMTAEEPVQQEALSARGRQRLDRTVISAVAPARPGSALVQRTRAVVGRLSLRFQREALA